MIHHWTVEARKHSLWSNFMMFSSQTFMWAWCTIHSKPEHAINPIKNWNGNVYARVFPIACVAENLHQLTMTRSIMLSSGFNVDWRCHWDCNKAHISIDEANLIAMSDIKFFFHWWCVNMKLSQLIAKYASLWKLLCNLLRSFLIKLQNRWGLKYVISP